MKFSDELKLYAEKKIECYINGLPDKDDDGETDSCVGIIDKVEEDYIIFKITTVKTRKTKKKGDEEKVSVTLIEKIKIPINQISSLSEGTAKENLANTIILPEPNQAIKEIKEQMSKDQLIK